MKKKQKYNSTFSGGGKDRFLISRPTDTQITLTKDILYSISIKADSVPDLVLGFGESGLWNERFRIKVLDPHIESSSWTSRIGMMEKANNAAAGGQRKFLVRSLTYDDVRKLTNRLKFTKASLNPENIAYLRTFIPQYTKSIELPNIRKASITIYEIEECLVLLRRFLSSLPTNTSWPPIP
ncbi:hypothetical protein HK098_007459, partial [Nowakowskiella sp. JEL0407]